MNNLIGGLGLNCGIHDATDLAALLCAVIKDEMPDDALVRYDVRRRSINTGNIRPRAVANKSRLEEKDASTGEVKFVLPRKIVPKWHGDKPICSAAYIQNDIDGRP